MKTDKADDSHERNMKQQEDEKDVSENTDEWISIEWLEFIKSNIAESESHFQI